mmetsp:Transcript_14627/g.14731  ORF Transcript_14627/g.14731 Transcript_14627/m.14731 type:complete len:140 (+) Transcript_14627:635-1054(+)
MHYILTALYLLAITTIFRMHTLLAHLSLSFLRLYFIQPLYSNLKTALSRNAQEEPFHAGLLAGMISGTFAGIITTPGDMVKTTIQRGDGGVSTLTAIRRVIRTEGSGALFRGWNTRAMIVGISYALISSVFEFQKRLLS